MPGSDVRPCGAIEELSHYRILQKLSSGGMADIYLAEDRNLRRAVALKVLPLERRDDEVLQERLMREARAASALSHPNIARIYDAGRDAQSLYIAMEYIDGETLEQRIAREAPSIPFITRVATELASALEEAHSHGIVHRDIKAANVMLTKHDEVKVLDFGLAKFSTPELSVDQSTSWKTQSGIVMGTVPYMSPEQVRGEQADARSDLFAFGVLLYQLITRRLPFDGTSIADTFYRITNRQPEPMARFNYDLPPELERIARKCLEKEPSRRYQSASDLLVDLRNFERDCRVAPGPHARVSDIRLLINRRRARIWAVLLLLVALAVAIYVFRPTRAAALEVRSLAVLPFRYEGTSGFEDVSDGLADVVISDLAKTGGLRVLARSTSARYAGKLPVDAGRALRVDAVLAGRVVRSGEKLIVSTEIVRARDGTLIAGKRFERTVADIPTLAAAISSDTVRALRMKHSSATDEVEATEEAYRLYLRGRKEGNKRTPEGLREAIELYRQAVEISPEFAAAFAGLADAYSLLERYANVPNAESRDRAVAAAQRAVELDPNLPEAHVSLASVRETYAWDWRGAESEYHRALGLSPSSATAHHWYAMLLARLGRFDDAGVEIRVARELDPLSPLIASAQANIDYYRGDYRASIEAAHAALQLAPDFTLARLQLALSLLMSGDSSGAMRELEPLHGRSPEVAAVEAIARGRSGDVATARAFVEAAGSKNRGAGAEYAIAAVCMAAGDAPRAMTWLNNAYQNHSFWLAFLAVDPMFAPLRSDPRFDELLLKVGLR